MHRFYRNTVEHVFFGSGQFSELANLVFETVEISEFAHVEFLPMPIKVNSAERLTHRFSVLAPNFRSCWVYRKYLLYQKEGKGVVMTKYIGILFQRIRLDPRHDVNGFFTLCITWIPFFTSWSLMDSLRPLRSTRSWRKRFRYMKNGIHVMHNVN